MAPGYEITGPIEETLRPLFGIDLLILGETLEHLDSPEDVLILAHPRSVALLISTPIGERDLGNPEHYWGWDVEAVSEMLTDCGWVSIRRVDVLLPDTYSYQVHLALRA
jgi:hypothetical protein